MARSTGVLILHKSNLVMMMGADERPYERKFGEKPNPSHTVNDRLAIVGEVWGAERICWGEDHQKGEEKR
jgi:hypothetical protein